MSSSVSSNSPENSAVVTKKRRARTGCITCRIRKIKCDETKPNCKKCTDTGRKCDGYTRLDQTPRPKEHVELAPVPIPHLTKAVRVANPQTDVSLLSTPLPAIDLHWISHFSLFTGPSLSGFADKDFWCRTLPQLSINDAAIRHALMAVASYYAQFESKVPTNREIPLRYYSMAISELQRQIKCRVGAAEAPVICCLLFICLECLHGNQDVAASHVINGLKLLRTTQSESLQSSQPLVKAKLQDIFKRLDAQSTMFGQPGSRNPFEIVRDSDDMTLSFNDLGSAQRSLDSIIALSLTFIRSVYDGRYCGEDTGVSQQMLVERLQRRFFRWTIAMDELEIQLGNDPGLMANAGMLRTQEIACLVYLSNCFEEQEYSFSAYHSEFAMIVQLSQVALEQKRKEAELTSYPMFSLEAAIIPPLYLTAIKCRDNAIRYEALRLLEIESGHEGLWNSKLHARVARRTADMEQGTFEDAVHLIPGYIPPPEIASQRVWILPQNIARNHEEHCGSVKATFWACLNGRFDTPVHQWDEDILV